MLSTCFPSVSLEFGTCSAEYLCDQPPTTTLGTGSLMSFSSRQHFTCVVTFVAGGCNHVSDSTGRGLLEVCSWLSLDFTPWAFSFADLDFHHFTTINHSCEDDSLVNHQTWGWSWEALSTTVWWCQLCGLCCPDSFINWFSLNWANERHWRESRKERREEPELFFPPSWPQTDRVSGDDPNPCAGMTPLPCCC